MSGKRPRGIQALLQELGIQPHTALVVEAFPTDNAPLEDAVSALFQALTDDLNPDTTLVAPTCTPREGRPKPTFDPLLSPSEMGPFSEFFRRQAGVIRSHNPTHSVAALGPAAKQIVSGHRSSHGRPSPWGEGAFGYGSPWDVLVELDAWWLMISPDWTQSPFTTYLQAVYSARHAGLTKETPFPEIDGEALRRLLAQAGVLHEGYWFAHPLVAFRLRTALDVGLEALGKEPASLLPGKEVADWLHTVTALRHTGHLCAGFSKVVITPPTPCSRWEGKQLTGVYRDLFARSMALATASGRAALVVCDLLGISKDLVGRIRQRVHRRIGLTPDKVMICATHAHSTPDTVGSGNADPGYLETLVEAIAGGICRAFTNLQPARLGWGRTQIRGLAHSRRVRMVDGSVFTTRFGVPSTWRVKPDLIAGRGEIDPDLTVVRLESLDGAVLGLAANFACHPSVALMSSSVSGDFFGEAMYALEGGLGGAAVALISNGPAADVDPTLEMPVWGPRNDANALRLGRLLAAQVLELLERTAVKDTVSVAAVSESIELSIRPDWLKMVQSDREKLKQEFSQLDLENSILSRIIDREYIPTEVQALQIGDLVLLGLPGEVFARTGLKIKDRIAGRRISVIEAANDYIGYILTPEAAAEGGYETGLHWFTRVGQEAEGRIIQASLRLLERLSPDLVRA